MLNSHRGFQRFLSILMISFMLLSGAFAIMPAEVNAATTVKIGQACNDERGKTRGGKAGDQKGGEVSISKWSYSSKSGAYNNWKYVIRLKDSKKAVKLANSMKKACANNHIGYDQKSPDRNSCYDEAKKVGWDLSAITTDCETTCAAIVSVCLNTVGIKAPRYWDSSLVYKFCRNNGGFYIYSSSKYTSKSTNLEAGDILLSPGKHTAMVVQSPNTPGSTNSYETISASNNSTTTTTSPFKAGLEYKLNTELNVRKGPGKSYAIKSHDELTENAKQYATSTTNAVLGEGTVVTCIKTSGNWIKIPSGWICGKYDGEYYITKNTSSTENSSSDKTTETKTNTNTTSNKSNSSSSSSSSSKVTVKAGKDYKLCKALNVRRGPGKNYSVKRRTELSADAKKHSYNYDRACLKKGTVVTCIKKRGDWMKIPSGWICCKQGNVENA